MSLPTAPKIRYQYYDFVFKIRQTDQEYIVEAVSPDRESKTYPLAQPEWPDQIEAPVVADPTVAQQFGRHLFKSIFRGPILNTYRQYLRNIKAEQENMAAGYAKGLRLIVDLEQAPNLTRIPWEFLCDEEKEGVIFLCLDPQTPVVRRLRPGARPGNLKSPLTFSLLSAMPGGTMPLGKTQEEIRVIEDILKSNDNVAVKPHRLAAKVSDLLSAMKEQPNIVHFTGHGDDNRLVFDDKELSAEQINQILNVNHALRLAVINACEAGRQVTKTLAGGGIPAIIAMQFKVTDLAGAAFAREFYENLMAGYALETALGFARVQMSCAAVEGSLEWATPVLYLQTASESVLGDILLTTPEPQAASILDVSLPDADEKVFHFLLQQGKICSGQGNHQAALAFLEGAKLLSQTQPSFGIFEEDINKSIEVSQIELAEAQRLARLELSKNVLFEQAREYAQNNQWADALNLLGTIGHLQQDISQPEAKAEQTFNVSGEMNKFYQNVRQELTRMRENQARLTRLEAFYRKAEEKWNKEEWDEAIIFFDKADEELHALKHRQAEVDPCFQDTEKRANQARIQKRLHQFYELGISFFEKENWDEAVKAFKQVDELNPSFQENQWYFSEARRKKKQEDIYQQGKAAIQAKNWRSAIDTLQTIKSGEHRFQDAFLALNYAQGHLYIQDQNWAGAVEALDTVVRRRPDFEGDAQQLHQQARFRQELQERYQSGHQAIKDKEWKKAKVDLERVQYEQRDKPKIYNNIDELLTLIDEEILLAEQYKQAQRFLDTGNWQRTIDLLEQIHTRRDTYENSGQMLEQARRELEIEIEFDRGRKAALDQQWPDAIQSFQRVLELNNNHPEAQQGLDTARRTQTMQQNYRQGITFLEKGAANFDTETLELAIQHLQQVVEIEPDFRGDAEAKLKEAQRLLEAERNYQKALQAEKVEDWPRAVKLWQQVVDLARDLNRDYRNSAQRLKQALQQQDLDNLYCQVQTHRANHAWAEAKAVLTDLVKRANDYGLAPYKETPQWLNQAKREAQIADHYEDGLLCMDAERWDDALMCFNRVLELNPGHHQAQAQLKEAQRQRQLKNNYQQGLNAFQTKAWDQTISHLEQVVKEERHYKDATGRLETALHQQKLAGLYAQGVEYAQQGEWEQAFDCFDEIKRADPDYHDIQAQWHRAYEYKEINRKYQLARKFEEEGKLEEAIKLYDEVEKRRQNVC
ncbi:MAG: CHAT domain-containing protein [Anaerolineae bacterium]|nr:CHAT domain-containing protein [Anaerolineae bacterium]